MATLAELQTAEADAEAAMNAARIVFDSAWLAAEGAHAAVVKAKQDAVSAALVAVRFTRASPPYVSGGFQAGDVGHMDSAIAAQLIASGDAVAV